MGIIGRFCLRGDKGRFGSAKPPISATLPGERARDDESDLRINRRVGTTHRFRDPDFDTLRDFRGRDKRNLELFGVLG